MYLSDGSIETRFFQFRRNRNSVELVVISSDPSLFCALVKTVLYRAYETLQQRLRDSLGCEDCSTNTNVNLLTVLPDGTVSQLFQITGQIFGFRQGHLSLTHSFGTNP